MTVILFVGQIERVLLLPFLVVSQYLSFPAFHGTGKEMQTKVRAIIGLFRGSRPK